jgi:hypothetical protein
MTNLQFIRKISEIKWGSRLELELKDPSDSNISIKSIEQKWSEEERTVDGFCCLK